MCCAVATSVLAAMGARHHPAVGTISTITSPARKAPAAASRKPIGVLFWLVHTLMPISAKTSSAKTSSARTRSDSAGPSRWGHYSRNQGFFVHTSTSRRKERGGSLPPCGEGDLRPCASGVGGQFVAKRGPPPRSLRASPSPQGGGSQVSTFSPAAFTPVAFSSATPAVKPCTTVETSTVKATIAHNSAMSTSSTCVAA